MSESLPGPFPAVPAPVAPGVCPTCGQKLPRPSLLRRAAHALRVVAHDPQVDRAGKSLAMILLMRALVAAGASAEVVHVVAALAHVAVPGV